MIQTVIKGRGGTIETYFVDRQVTSCTVSVYTGDGAAKVTDAACTVDSVNTIITAAASAGDVALTLSTVANVAANRRYLLSGATPEVVTVKAIDQATKIVSLVAPLLHDVENSSAIQGTRVTYAVSSSQADVLWWDGYADFTPNSGDIQSEVVDCVLRKIPDNLIDETDVRSVLPKAAQILDAELDMPNALREARDEFVRQFGGKNRAYCCLGADHFRQPVAIMFWLQRRYALGEEWAPMMERMEQDLAVLIQKIQVQIPFDNDQDGKTNGLNDGGYTTVRIGRA